MEITPNFQKGEVTKSTNHLTIKDSVVMHDGVVTWRVRSK